MGKHSENHFSTRENFSAPVDQQRANERRRCSSSRWLPRSVARLAAHLRVHRRSARHRPRLRLDRTMSLARLAASARRPPRRSRVARVVRPRLVVVGPPRRRPGAPRAPPRIHPPRARAPALRARPRFPRPTAPCARPGRRRHRVPRPEPRRLRRSRRRVRILRLRLLRRPGRFHRPGRLRDGSRPVRPRHLRAPRGPRPRVRVPRDPPRVRRGQSSTRGGGGPPQRQGRR